MAADGMATLEENQTLCYERLDWAFKSLEVQADEKQISRIALLIADAMSGPWRHFHTTRHILEVGNSDDALEVLAALFHDLIYVQVDQAIAINQSYYVAPFIKESEGQLIVRKSTLPDDPMFALVACIFAVEPGQTLSPYGGLNEFLSALFCAKALQDLMSKAQLAEICACIEATIPFRGVDAQGRSMAERLKQHLSRAEAQFSLGMAELDIDAAVKRAVRVANRDIANFGESDVAHFLDNTWHLLPETNHVLKNTSAYTVTDYRITLQKMEGFMSHLEAKRVFQRFQDEPPEERYQTDFAHAERNIRVARLYLRAKLVSISILEALSLRIGSHIPVAFMMGELPSVQQQTTRLEDFLPPLQHVWQASTPEEQLVFELLSEGRSQESFYDLKHSPLATFVVKHIGLPEVLVLHTQVQRWYKGEISAEAFLEACEPRMLDAIICSLVQLLQTRKMALQQQAVDTQTIQCVPTWRVRLARLLLN